MTYGVDIDPLDVVAADFNGDGFIDLASTTAGSNSVSLLAGNGDGTFQAHVTTAVGSGPRGVATGDLDGDGVPDVVVANTSDSTITALVNDAAPTPPPPAPPQPVVTGGATQSGAVIVTMPDGTTTTLTPFGSGWTGGVNVAAGDVNGDGLADIIVAAGPGGGPHVKVFDASATELDSFFAYDRAFVGGATVGAGVGAQFRVGSGPGMAPRVKTFGPAFDLLSDEPVFTTDFLGGVMVG